MTDNRMRPCRHQGRDPRSTYESRYGRNDVNCSLQIAKEAVTGKSPPLFIKLAPYRRMVDIASRTDSAADSKLFAEQMTQMARMDAVRMQVIRRLYEVCFNKKRR